MSSFFYVGSKERPFGLRALRIRECEVRRVIPSSKKFGEGIGALRRSECEVKHAPKECIPPLERLLPIPISQLGTGV